jgi:glyoxylase-like metal-dependent hydrolase (beta-lactamase superfamily II)
VTSRQSDDGSAWPAVGVGCFQRRYGPLDVTVGVVRGEHGLLVVDSLASPTEARQLRADLAQRWPAPVRHLLNTHGHFDHCFGNEVFADATIWGHHSLPAYLRRQAVASRAAAVRYGYRPAELPPSVLAPDHLVTSTTTLDLGGVAVHLRHLGRGHTDGDLVAHVPAAGVVFCGDLVEQSGPPQFGDDSYPLDWPAALTRLLELAGPDCVFVPGHGAPVDAAFVRAQRDVLAAVADAIRLAFQRGLTLSAAADLVRASVGDLGGRSAPPTELTDAVRRGYARLATAGPPVTGAGQGTDTD